MKLPVAIVIDLVLIVLFAVIGRASHGEAVSAGGVLVTAWPFLLGGALGWAVSWLFRRAAGGPSNGVIVWVFTVVVGMLVRALTAATVATSFVIVATIVLAILLIGWRWLYSTVLRRRTATAR